jgi:hypothetical protein
MNYWKPYGTQEKELPFVSSVEQHEAQICRMFNSDTNAFAQIL